MSSQSWAVKPGDHSARANAIREAQGNGFTRESMLEALRSAKVVNRLDAIFHGGYSDDLKPGVIHKFDEAVARVRRAQDTWTRAQAALQTKDGRFLATPLGAEEARDFSADSTELELPDQRKPIAKAREKVEGPERKALDQASKELAAAQENLADVLVKDFETDLLVRANK